MRGQQSLHQILQAIRFLDDDLSIFTQARIIKLMLKQLCRSANSAKRVLDFVRQIANQLAAGFLLFNELPTIWTLIGAAVVVISTLSITWREQQLAKQARIRAAAEV